MEVSVIKGGKKNNDVYLINDINEVFMKKSVKSGKIYVECYFNKTCSAKGVISENLFFPSEKFNLHSNHAFPTSSLMSKFEFHEALRNQCQKVGSTLKNIFDDTYLR